jgi:hypothetical protein
MEWIKVVKDLSTPDEYSVSHLIEMVFEGEWDEKEKGYVVTHNGDTILVKQDEVESEACAYCDNRSMEYANICIECLAEGMEEDEQRRVS